MRSIRHKSVITHKNDFVRTSFKFNENLRTHMHDVMRLAFLENNDIAPEEEEEIDFNSFSTASILKRNIQQQLQHQLEEQQVRAKQQQQKLILQRAIHQQRQMQQQQRRRLQEQYQLEHYQQQQQQLCSPPDQHDFADGQEETFANDDQHLDQYQDQYNNNRDQGEEDALGHSVDTSSIFETTMPSATPSPQHHHHHQVNNRSGEFHCDQPDCGKSFPSLRKLRHHKVVHSDNFPFTCQAKGCEKKFKRKFGIDLHSTTHFDLDPKMYSKTSNDSSLPFFGRRMQYSMCKQCGEKFKTVHDYQNHMLNHHGKEPFKCPVKNCGQSFSIWKSFQKHRASHYYNYHCRMDSQCEHVTSNLQLLKLHIYCCHFKRKLPNNTIAITTSSSIADEEEEEVSPVNDDEEDDGLELTISTDSRPVQSLPSINSRTRSGRRAPKRFKYPA